MVSETKQTETQEGFKKIPEKIEVPQASDALDKMAQEMGSDMDKMAQVHAHKRKLDVRVANVTDPEEYLKVLKEYTITAEQLI